MPKLKFTKEIIVNAAYDILKEVILDLKKAKDEEK